MVAYEADGWSALGDPSRREILRRLAERPRSVTEIADDLPISRPAVSQHLRVLKEARLVLVRPEGTRRIYEVDLNGLATLREEIDEFWGNALENFKRIAEQETELP